MCLVCAERRYKAVRDKYPVPENETASHKAARLFEMTREILRQFNMLEKLTHKEVRVLFLELSNKVS